MKCIVTDEHGLKLGGVMYQRGAVVEILGKELRELYEGRIMEIQDAVLVRELQLNSHPLVVTEPGVWGRKQYQVGDILWVPSRMHAKIVAGWTRPATGEEVLAAIARREGKAPPAAPAPREPTPIGTREPREPRRPKRRRAKRAKAVGQPSRPVAPVDAVQREIDEKLAAIGVRSTRA